MLLKGFEIDFVAEMTELTLAEIDKIRKNLGIIK